jgi:hypothetical protein
MIRVWIRRVKTKNFIFAEDSSKLCENIIFTRKCCRIWRKKKLCNVCNDELMLLMTPEYTKFAVSQVKEKILSNFI